jgi:hypothetical protein
VVALWGCGLLVAVRLILFGWHYAGQLNVRALAVSTVVTVVGACKSHCMLPEQAKLLVQLHRMLPASQDTHCHSVLDGVVLNISL